MSEPKVRFKRNNGSYYPTWTVYSVSDLFEKINEKNKNCENENVITNSAEFGLIPQRDYFDKDIAVEGKTENYTIIRKGDFVYNPRKSASAPMGPFNCYQLDEEGIVSPLYSCLRPKGVLEPEFLLRYFQTDKWYKYVNDHGAQNGARHDRVGMTDKILMGIPVTAPCSEEQKKIADFLLSIETVIAASEDEVANLETQKKAAMKKIFSQEVRFKKADGIDYPQWQERMLGEIADVSKLAGFEFTKYVNYSEKGKIIAIRGLNVKSGTLILDNVKYLDGSDFAKLNRSKLYVNDIMFTYVGTIGDAALVPENDKFYMAPNVCRIRVFKELPVFIMQQLLSDYFRRTIINPLIATSSQPALSMENIRLFKIRIPCLEEQCLIADFLSNFDEAIAAAKKELEMWKELKKGLLQQMFV